MEITKEEKQLIYDGLVKHDGQSMCPEWDIKKQNELTDALDKLRLMIHMSK